MGNNFIDELQLLASAAEASGDDFVDIAIKMIYEVCEMVNTLEEDLQSETNRANIYEKALNLYGRE